MYIHAKSNKEYKKTDPMMEDMTHIVALCRVIYTLVKGRLRVWKGYTFRGRYILTN